MSSKRRIRRRSCIGKVRYTCLEDAFKVRDRLNLSGYNVYHCRSCGGVHIGRKPLSVVKMIAGGELRA